MELHRRAARGIAVELRSDALECEVMVKRSGELTSMGIAVIGIASETPSEEGQRICFG